MWTCAPQFYREIVKQGSWIKSIQPMAVIQLFFLDVAHQLKKDDGTLTTDDTEKATMLNDYFCTIAEKLIGPADEIQPLHAHSRENVDMPIMTSITISQKEIEEKICKLKVKKATGPDGVSARLLKYAGMSIAPSLTSVFKQSVEACKPPDQRKIAS